MPMNYLMGISFVLGVLGLWVVLGALFNMFGFLTVKRKRIYDTDKDLGAAEEAHWPLFARVMKSIIVGFKKEDLPEANADLKIRLQKAGFPFYSPAHYYSRQFANTFLFGAFGLIMGIGYSATGSDISPVAVIGLSIGMAVFGSTRPAAEVKAGIEKRKKDLIMDMTAAMASLIVQIKAKNAPIQAVMAIVDSQRVQKEQNLEDIERIQNKINDEAANNAFMLGQTLAGFGGNLFADMLNRLAILLTENKKIEDAAAEIKDHYPYSLEMDQFLEIFAGGIRGELPMVERLLEFSKQLKNTRSQHRKEQGAQAQMIVSVANVFLLIPTVVLFIAPLLTQLGSFFGK
jgi:hypothetical protein